MENISVYIRLKPTKDKTESNFTYDSKTITNSKTKEIFSFDSVITPNMTNKDVFEKLIKQNLTSLLSGINVSIFAYGQTSTGKTFTMKGEPKINEGLIPLSIREIFNSLNNKDFSISKYVVKVSYAEIYNETVNDLIDSSKKNLEIRESGAKGIFVNNLSEIMVTNLEKAMQLLNKGENNRIIAETKLNEKSSRSHTIFKINIEFYLKDKNNKEKKYNSQLNLVDLAGSENVSKAKCEGVRIKEGGNINKSLLALSNVINKLSQNNKSFVNYRDSKLTRLLQTALGGNSKTTIICTIVDDNMHYSETLNTLHFGMKAKNIKTTVKVNEIINDKGKIAMENQALRNKIKMLEKLINDKKSLQEKENTNEENNGKKALSLLSSGNKNEIQNNEQISNLEKEVSLLKKYLMNNEEMGSDINSIQGGDWMSLQGGNDIYNNNIYNINSNLNTSAYKPSFKQRISNLSAIRGSGSAIKSIYFNSPCMPRIHQSEINNNSNINHLENNFRKNISMTEMRPAPYAPKNCFYSAIRKTAPQNNNFMFGSNMKFSIPDLNNYNNLSNLNSTNFDMGNDYLLKENEELKKNIYELKKTYYEVVQSKEQQIKLLNQNHDMTLENCEKLIKEAEANYLNLKTEYDLVMEKMKIKDSELNDLKEKNINQDSSINYYKKELNKVKDLNYASELEAKYNSLLDENIKLKQKEEEETAKLKEENDLLKKNINMIDNKYKEKCQELNDNQKLINEAKKQHEKELQKYKIEIKNYKSNIGKGRNVKNKGNIIDSDKIKEYENQINKLIQENNDYKNNLEKIEKTQIVEYQKLLDESFAKIAQLNKELNDSKDKNKYLEKALNIVEKTANKEEINRKDNIIELNEDNCKQNKNKDNENKKLQSTIRQNKNNYNNYSSNRRGKNSEYIKEENKEFLNKKRKGMPKIYQNVITKQQMNSDINQTPNKENNNILNTEFSNFEI